MEQTESAPVRRWDPIVKLTHWGIVAAVIGNALVTEEGSGWHVWVGYGLAALLALRLLWGLIGPAEARFSAFPPSPGRALDHLGDIGRGEVKHHASHNPLGALMVYAIWAVLLVVVGSGIAMSGPPPADPAAVSGEREGKGGEGGKGEGKETEEEEAEEGREAGSKVLPVALPSGAAAARVREERGEDEEAEERRENGRKPIATSAAPQGKSSGEALELGGGEERREAAERREAMAQASAAPLASDAVAAMGDPAGLTATGEVGEAGEAGEGGEDEGEEALEEMHEIAVNLLYVLIALHLAGVVFETRRSGRQIVQAMIPGGSRQG